MSAWRERWDRFWFAEGSTRALGVFRILMNWRIEVMIMVGYLLVVAMTAMAPREIVGIAYDSGGVTTSTVTVPSSSSRSTSRSTAFRSHRTASLSGVMPRPR